MLDFLDTGAVSAAVFEAILASGDPELIDLLHKNAGALRSVIRAEVRSYNSRFSDPSLRSNHEISWGDLQRIAKRWNLSTVYSVDPVTNNVPASLRDVVIADKDAPYTQHSVYRFKSAGAPAHSSKLEHVRGKWVGRTDPRWWYGEALARTDEPATDRAREEVGPYIGRVSRSGKAPRRSSAPKREQTAISLATALIAALESRTGAPLSGGVQRVGENRFRSYMQPLRDAYREVGGQHFDEAIRRNRIEILSDVAAYAGRSNPIVEYVIYADLA